MKEYRRAKRAKMTRVTLRKDCMFWTATVADVTIPTTYDAALTFENVAQAILAHNRHLSIEIAHAGGSEVIAGLRYGGKQAADKSGS